MIPREISPGIFKHEKWYYTANLLPGKSHHGEELKTIAGREYRHWDPSRSKLGAYLALGKRLSLTGKMNILYLGAGDGTTVSYLSDVIAGGRIFAVEMAGKPYRNLLNLSGTRKNIYPIMGDARHPHEYREIFPRVDFVYQDISQRDQGDIFLKNVCFLKCRGEGMLAVKIRSIDSAGNPDEIIRDMKKELANGGLEITDATDIGRWQKDHVILRIVRD